MLVFARRLFCRINGFTIGGAVLSRQEVISLGLKGLMRKQTELYEGVKMFDSFLLHALVWQNPKAGLKTGMINLCGCLLFQSALRSELLIGRMHLIQAISKQHNNGRSSERAALGLKVSIRGRCVVFKTTVQTVRFIFKKVGFVTFVHHHTFNFMHVFMVFYFLWNSYIFFILCRKKSWFPTGSEMGNPFR